MAGGNVGNGMQAKLRGDILSFPVKIATAIYRGTPVAIDASGYLVEADDSAALSFVGIAEESNTVVEAVADGTINCRVRRRGIFKMKLTGVAVTDVGKRCYAETAQTASVDNAVALAAASTYLNLVGQIVKYDAANSCWVDISPSHFVNVDVTTHEALAGQDAHTLSAIAPTVVTETITNPTTTALEFFGGVIKCSYAGAVTIVLPASGIALGTVCRIVKTGSAGLFAISATTLIGPQCASNAFIGCPNPGDSVDIMCIANDSYVVLGVNQSMLTSAIVGDSTATAAEFMGGTITATKSTAQALTLPASGVPIGARCVIKRLVNASAVTISASALDGGASSGNAHAACNAIGDSVIIECNGADDYTVIAESVA